jgi:hypothetical protein
MLNFLGDVGALNSVLTSLAAALLLNVMRLDLSLENDFFESIFRKRTENKSILKSEKLKPSYLISLLLQVSPLVRIVSCCRPGILQKNKQRKKLVDRMDRELDVTNFIRNQILLKNYIRAVTTKSARALSRHNYSLM